MVRRRAVTALATDALVGGLGAWPILVAVAELAWVRHVAMQAADDAVADMDRLAADLLGLVRVACVARGPPPARILALVEVRFPDGPEAALSVTADQGEVPVGRCRKRSRPGSRTPGHRSWSGP